MMELENTYQLVGLIRNDGIRTYRVVEKLSGQPLELHLFAGKDLAEDRHLFEALRALPLSRRRQLIELGEEAGVPSVPNVLGVIILGFALALHVISGRASPLLTAVPAAVALIAVVATILAGRLAARVEQRVSDRRGSDSRIAASFRALSEGVGDALSLLREADPLLLIGLVGYLVFDVMILWATFHAFGDVPPLAIIWIGYLIGELGGLIPLPGGIGGVDLGLVGALVLYKVPVGAATAAVLGYRAIALVVPVVLGAVAFLRLRRSLAREAVAVANCGPGELVVVVGVGEAQLEG